MDGWIEKLFVLCHNPSNLILGLIDSIELFSFCFTSQLKSKYEQHQKLTCGRGRGRGGGGPRLLAHLAEGQQAAVREGAGATAPGSGRGGTALRCEQPPWGPREKGATGGAALPFPNLAPTLASTLRRCTDPLDLRGEV